MEVFVTSIGDLEVWAATMVCSSVQRRISAEYQQIKSCETYRRMVYTSTIRLVRIDMEYVKHWFHKEATVKYYKYLSGKKRKMV